MAQNNKLKRRAQAFMADHEGVTYLNALKAVDEPLHQLRDLLNNKTRYTNFFRLVAEQGSYRPVTTADGDSDRDLIAKLGLSEYLSMWKFIDDVADRRKLLKTHGLRDIWEYRALKRSGVLGSEDDAPAMEPIFHHYAYNLSDPFAPMFGTEHLGIFPVNVSSMTEIREIEDFIPVTLEQLHTLATGEGSLGKIAPTPYDEADIRDPRVWTDHYDILAVSRNRTTAYNVRVFSILFKGSIEELHAELRAKGLNPLDFTFEDVSQSQIDFHQFESNLYAQQSGRSLFELASTQNNLLWG